MESAPPPWGLKKTLKFALPLMAVAGLVVYAYLPHDQKLKVSSAKGGECILMPDGAVAGTLRQRDCDRSHDGEIFQTIRDYPGDPAADAPSPQESCLERTPEGFSADETVLWRRIVDTIVSSGNPIVLLTNNADETVERDYVCVVTFPERTGSFLEEVVAQVVSTTSTTVPG